MTKSKKEYKQALRQYVPLLILLLLLLLLNSPKASAIARGYDTNDKGLQTGMVVELSLASGASNTVERASQDSSYKVVGVVTTFDNSLVTVGSSISKVLVESEGEVDGYVSDINGKVHMGDQLVLSPLKGILMKGVSDQSGTIVAIAADNPLTETPYNYQAGNKALQANIAKVKLNLNHLGTQKNGAAIADTPLTRLGRAIVGKEVSEVRVLISMIIFIIVLITEGSILYGAISSSMLSLGRNPLARKTIRSELIRVVVVAITVLIVGLGAVFGILKA